MALEGSKELDEVLSFSVVLHKVLLNLVEGLSAEVFTGVGVEDRKDAFDLLHTQLLGEHVVLGTTGSPELGLTGGGIVHAVFGLLLFLLH